MAGCRDAAAPGVRRLGIGKAAGRWGGGGDDSELDVFAADRYFNGDDDGDAPWCARSPSSSSLSSTFRTTGTQELGRSAATATAATSSSEASWNSRSALLPGGNKVRAAAGVATGGVEAEPSGTGGDQRVRGRLAPSPAPSSNLRRWLVGVAGCACVGGGDGEESASAAAADDGECRGEVEDGNVVGVGSKADLTTTYEAGELFRRTESKELAVVEATAVRVRPGRWLDVGDEFLAGHGQRRGGNSGEFSTPFSNPAAAAALHEQGRNSSDLLRHLGDNGSSTLVSMTIVAGNTARGGGLHSAAAAAGDSSEDDGEAGCAYPPSERSVVWSVATAEGVASCNFSSAASGYYCRRHHHIVGDDGAFRHHSGRRNRRRNSCGLLTCMGDKAVDAVGAAAPGRLGAHSGGRNGALT